MLVKTTAVLVVMGRALLSSAQDSPHPPFNLNYTINIHHSSPYTTTNLTILHQRPTTPTLTKRTPSRRLTTCPIPTPSLDPSTFLHSRCQRIVNAVAYTITCREVWDIGPDDGTRYIKTVDQEGECQENEICVDGYGSDVEEGGAERGEEGVSVAYCVSMGNFVEIVGQRVAHYDEGVEDIEKLDVGGDGDGDGDLVGDGNGNGNESTVGGSGMGWEYERGVEIVLTKPDRKSILYAKGMRLHAQTFEDMYGTKVWRTVKDGKVDCKLCSSLLMRRLPKEARRVHVDVMLSGLDLDAGGLMYLLGL